MKQQIKIIGVGGIGTSLLPFLSRYLNFDKTRPCQVTLVDADDVEDKNLKRQSFKKFGNKASIKAVEMAQEFRNISFRAVPEFVTPKNISEIIQEGDIVFLSVDNHLTRKLVSDYCETLSDVVLISGGNELTDGNVQVHIRRDGKNIKDPITKFHPEIKNAKGKSPGEMGCEELARQPGSEQTLVANMEAACQMFRIFWLIEQGELDEIGETYFDIKKGSVQTIIRKVNHG